jgi:hypothetical protein
MYTPVTGMPWLRSSFSSSRPSEKERSNWPSSCGTPMLEMVMVALLR